MSYALQEVLNRGSGSLNQPRISTRTSFPMAAKTGTNDPNNSTWVVGYTAGWRRPPGSATHSAAKTGRAAT